MKRNTAAKGQQGFTLIELLVVIAIIAILAAILFPVFAKAREKARQTSCASNEKQMGTAIMQYTQDYDERYPGRFNGDELYSWRAVVQPYIKNRQVFSCPSNAKNTDTCMDGFPRSYGANGYDSKDTPMHANAGSSIAQVNAPASCIMVCESTRNYSEIPMTHCYSWRGSSKGCIFLGHNGTGNFLFCDGHVKAMKLTATASYTGPLNMWACAGPNVNPFNNDHINEMAQNQAAYEN